MSFLNISFDQCGLPLGAGPGVDKALPSDLRDRIFGTRSHVYAVIDGGRVPGLPERLAAPDTQASCLFTGEMAEDAQDTAPWLVRLSPHAPLLRQMLCDLPEDTAGVHGVLRRGAGILVRTDMNLGDLRAHLRRFLRVTDDTGKSYFFRFWEPDAAAVYFRAIADRTDVAHRWMFPREGAMIEAILIPTWLDGVGMMQVTPSAACDPEKEPGGQFMLGTAEIDAFRALQWRRDKQQLMDRLNKTFPDAAGALGEELASRVSAVVDRMVGYGFWRRDMLFTFCAWDIHYGADVLARDPEGEVQAALDAPGSAEDRFARIAKRMDVLERSHLANPALLG